MYDELVKRLRSNAVYLPEKFSKNADLLDVLMKAADAIEELQATICNWCAVCPEDKRDLSTCEIYESCRAKPPREET